MTDSQAIVIQNLMKKFGADPAGVIQGLKKIPGMTDERVLEIISALHPRGVQRKGKLEKKASWRRLSEVEKRDVDWLWPGRLPLGMLAMFAGDPSLGKSTMAFDFMARGSVGAPEWLDGQPNTYGSFESIVLIAEDDVASIVRPRIEAAGGDPAKIHELRAITYVNPEDLKASEERLVALGEDLGEIRNKLVDEPAIKFVFVDPLSNYLGNQDLFKEQEIRRVLSPIRTVAEDLRVTFLFNAHFNKQSGHTALHKIIGAVGNVGVCRIAWSFVKSQKNPDLKEMLLMKENLGKFPGLTFTTESVDVEVGGRQRSHARIKYVGNSKASIDAILAEADEPQGKAERIATQLIKKLVPVGEEVRSAVVYEAAEAAGVSERTLKRAREELKLSTVKKKDGWYWSWPKDREAMDEQGAIF